MSSSGRDSDSWDQGHGMAAGDPSQSPAGERVGQSRTGFLEEEKQKEWGGQCFIRLFIHPSTHPIIQQVFTECLPMANE